MPMIRLFLFVFLFVTSWQSQASANEAVPEPAKPVDLQRYLGKWNEFARYENRFEKGCEAVTAEYGLRDDGLVSVKNSCKMNGETKSTTGKAKIVAGSQNAKLKISFFGPFFFGDYWVLDRGDNYEWSIVGEPSGKYLWILTRAKTVSLAEKNRLIARVKQLGYNPHLLVFPTGN